VPRERSRDRAASAQQENTGGTNVINTGVINQLNVGVPSSITFPFIDVRQANIYGSGAATLVLPSRAEYTSGSIRPLREIAVVTSLLSQEGLAKIVGDSGVGKTTLALLVAYDDDSYKTAYYVDFADLNTPLNIADTAQLLERMATLDAANVLFILDNVHLDSRAEKSVFSHWRATDREASMLVMSRRRDRQDPFGTRVVSLTVNNDALMAVWDRVKSATSAPLPDPPTGALAEWAADFPDLISFTFAMRSRIRLLSSGAWKLSQKDAVGFIREKYIAGRTATEQENLHRLAAVGKYEFGLAERSLAPDGLARLIQEGLVRAQTRYYSLEHPATARLLLQAFGTANEFGMLGALADSEPYVISGIGAILARTGRRSEARRLVGRLVGDDGLRGDIVAEFNLSNLVRIARQVVSLNLLTMADIDGQLHGEYQTLLDKTASANPEEATIFLRFAHEHLPRTSGMFQSLLDDPDVQQELVNWAFDTPPWRLLSAAMMLRNMHGALANRLLEILFTARREDVLEALATASEANLGSLQKAAFFTGHSDEVAADIRLVLETRMTDVVRHVLLRGLQEVMQYSGRLDQAFPEFADRFWAALTSEPLLEAFDRALDEAPLILVVRMMKWARPRLQGKLAGQVEAEVRKKLTSQAVCDMRPGDIKFIIGFAEGDPAFQFAIDRIYNAVAANIPHVARVSLSRGLDVFVQLGRILEPDRPDLARAVLRTLTGDAMAQVLSDQLEVASDQARRQLLTWLQTDGTVSVPGLGQR